MEIFKKLVNNLSSLINAESEPDSEPKSKPESKPKPEFKTINTYMSKKTMNYSPNYSAYVSVHSHDDIYRISLDKHIFNRFPKIAAEYSKAIKSYYDIKSSNSNTPDYAESFAHLNKVFYMIVNRLCTNSGADCIGKGLYAMSDSLPMVAGFNQEQMNVVHGILYMIDTHKNESDIVSERAIKTHFVSLGLILKVFKASECGEAISDVPCSFISMRAKAKKSAEISKNPDAVRNTRNAVIKESFSKAKKLNKDNHPKKAADMLEKTISLSIQKQCIDNNISFTNSDTPTELLDVLSNLNVIAPAFRETANKVLSYVAMLRNGKTPERKRVQSLIANTGSAIVNASCNNTKTPNVKKIVYPSFKEMEKKSQVYDYDLNKEYPQLSIFIKTAQKRIANGEYKEALVQYRNSLEFMVNTLCKKHGIDFDSKINLFDKIELLHTKNVITKNQLSLMHQARSLGNDGAHYNLDTISENDARRESDLITKILDIFKGLTAPLNGVKNTPMLDPDFYSNSRKYYGLCPYETRVEPLLNDMNYVRLKRRADNGDIEAMLDLATAFLPQPNKMKWGYDHLILSPNFEGDGYKALYNPFDSRYYYWLIQAGKQAYNDWIKGNTIPLKYIATALAESIKYMLDSYIYDSFAQPLFNDKMNYRTQKQLAEYLFDGDFSFDSSTICSFAVMLICMLDEYKCDMVNGSSIISALNDMSIRDIKCYVYMYNYYVNPNEKVSLDSKLLLDPNDTAMTYGGVILMKKDLFSDFHKLKDYILSQNNKKQ